MEQIEESHPKDSPPPPRGSFPPTRWSLVAVAGSDQTANRQALERLCHDYWPPLYTFFRSRGSSVEDAKDLTQTLLSGLIEREVFEGLSGERGRFRTFLLRCAKNLLANDRQARITQKRGGGAEHFSIDTEEGEACLRTLSDQEGLTPDLLYERQWSSRLLRRVMESLAHVYDQEGKAEIFRNLQPMIAGGEERGRYGELAGELGVSEASLRMMVFRMRKRYRTLLQDEIAQTVLDPADVDDEINHLMTLYQND
jgi:RNA polymerase sigma factor (sigma-70 family)